MPGSISHQATAELNVTQRNYYSATTTAVTTGLLSGTVPQPATAGDLLFTDNFSNPELWSVGRTAIGSIATANYGLSLVVSQPNGYLYTIRKSPSLTDFYLEITAGPSICRGSDEYGLLLRVSPDFDFYRFALTCDGRTRLDKYYHGAASSPQPLIYGSSVPPGAPSTSRLAVLAIGKEMRFYVNTEYQFTVRDSSLTSGLIGIFAHAASEDPVTVIYSDLTVAKPP
jgi:hypothetical protein